jgi:hypothetical protein
MGWNDACYIAQPQCLIPVQRKFNNGVYSPSPLFIQQNSPGMTAHRIVIRPTLDMKGRPKLSFKGPLFNASYEGEVIVVGSTEPCLDASRILKARGLTGRLEVWDTKLPYCRFHTDIAKAARSTIEEGDSLPRLRKYRVHPGGGAQDGNFASGGVPVAQTEENRPTDYSHRLLSYPDERSA